MYTITMDGETIASSSAETLSLINPIVTLEVNKTGSFEFTLLPDHPKYNSFVLRQSMIDVLLNGELIFEGVPVQESVDFYNRKRVTCEGELTFFNDTIQRQAVYNNQSVSTLLGAYLTNHNSQVAASHQFQLGIVTVDGGNSLYRYTNYNTTMTEINEDLIKDFGGYLRVRHDSGVRYIDYLDASPHTSSQVIRIGKNLLDLSKTISSADICTCLIPLGAKTGNQTIQGLDERLTIESVNGGLDYVTGTAAATYGNVWRVVTWDDVTTASALKAKGEAWLTEGQYANMVIEATALDLGLSEEDVEQFRLLDKIRVVSAPHGLDMYMMLTKLRIDLNHMGNTEVTLGEDKRLTLSAQTAQVSNDLVQAETTIEVSAANNARQILETATGGNIYFVYDSNGVCTEIRIMDTNDPNTATKIWRWNINGWGYSDDGGVTYKLAATMNGAILADFITAGTLASPNNKFSLDMNTGTVNMASANITGGSINIETNSQSSDVIKLAYDNPYINTHYENVMRSSSQRYSQTSTDANNNTNEYQTLVDGGLLTSAKYTNGTEVRSVQVQTDSVYVTDYSLGSMLSATSEYLRVSGLQGNSWQPWLALTMNGLQFYDSNGDPTALYPDAPSSFSITRDNLPSGGSDYSHGYRLGNVVTVQFAGHISAGAVRRRIASGLPTAKTETYGVLCCTSTKEAISVIINANGTELLTDTAISANGYYMGQIVYIAK